MVRDFFKRAFVLCVAFLILLSLFKSESFAFSKVAGETVAAATVDDSEFLDIPEEDVPLGILKTNTAVSWWWLFIIIVLGAVGAELISRKHMEADKKACTFESLSEIKNNVNV